MHEGGGGACDIYEHNGEAPYPAASKAGFQAQCIIGGIQFVLFVTPSFHLTVTLQQDAQPQSIFDDMLREHLGVAQDTSQRYYVLAVFAAFSSDNCRSRTTLVTVSPCVIVHCQCRGIFAADMHFFCLYSWHVTKQSVITQSLFPRKLPQGSMGRRSVGDKLLEVHRPSAQAPRTTTLPPSTATTSRSQTSECLLRCGRDGGRACATGMGS